jgi:hypothetical protein
MTNDKSLESPAARKAATTMTVAKTESFDAFDAWMDIELDRLVARWAHAAAPNANWPTQNRRQARFGR